MKRWLSGLLAALMLFSLTACGLAATTDLTEAPSAGGGQPEIVDLPTADPGEDEEAEPPGDGETGEDKDGDTLDSDAADPNAADAAAPSDGGNASEDNHAADEDPLPENGSYTSKEDVALYIHTYGRLPDNFISKKKAQELGWSGGSLEPYAPGKCIGGSRFGNYEGLLPDADGRRYTECDIDTLGARSRGARRIVFSNDGLIYYTEDHYATFELLYGEE